MSDKARKAIAARGEKRALANVPAEDDKDTKAKSETKQGAAEPAERDAVAKAEA